MKNVWGFLTRIGLPIDILGHGYNERVCSPIFATVIGLLKKGIENTDHTLYEETVDEEVKEELKEELPELESASVNNNNSKWYEQIFKKTKEWFEAEPDSEF